MRSSPNSARKGSIACDAVEGPDSDGSGTLFIASSKTDRERAGAIAYLSPATMQAIEEWKRAGAIDRRHAQGLDRAGEAWRGVRDRVEVSRAYPLSLRAKQSIVRARHPGWLRSARNGASPSPFTPIELRFRSADMGATCRHSTPPPVRLTGR